MSLFQAISFKIASEQLLNCFTVLLLKNCQVTTAKTRRKAIFSCSFCKSFAIPTKDFWISNRVRQPLQAILIPWNQVRVKWFLNLMLKGVWSNIFQHCWPASIMEHNLFLFFLFSLHPTLAFPLDSVNAAQSSISEIALTTKPTDG